MSDDFEPYETEPIEMTQKQYDRRMLRKANRRMMDDKYSGLLGTTIGFTFVFGIYLGERLAGVIK